MVILVIMMMVFMVISYNIMEIMDMVNKEIIMGWVVVVSLEVKIIKVVKIIVVFMVVSRFIY